MVRISYANRWSMDHRVGDLRGEFYEAGFHEAGFSSVGFLSVGRAVVARGGTANEWPITPD